ncbi:hypothetical protein BKA67DRAFT_665932 [Truncatella angustata]|uniref:Zn(2)-C6 fungal-type domain-containing protein n=1 Tax=Truncatella angustata TaxID=152316 RepID=A0A9P8UW33_9PEZI|nr:uncharacterized protein BKA67DRAFT_665932 [Truncatella angustata]KAH6659084.1 hypothetical protein BKA67DRAFT_665932 [Truncatella angustata]
MLGLGRRSAEDKRRKSRSGCSSCKARRIKCDETQPECQQCTRSHDECPGYSLPYKWSSKHEKYPGGDLDIQSGRKRRQPRLHQSLRQLTGSQLSDIDLHNDEMMPLTNMSLQSQHRENAPFSGKEIASMLFIDALLEPDAEAYPTPSYQAVLEKVHCNPKLWGDNLISDSSLIATYFSQTIIKNLCSYDSTRNPFRATISIGADNCLYSVLCRYLTLSYLTTSKPTEASQVQLTESRNEFLHRLHGEVSIVHQNKQTKWEKILLIFIMYGLASGWDGTDDAGRRYYNIAINMLQQRPHMHNYNLRFFNESLVYWWMGLSLTTNTESEHLLEPPAIDLQQSGVFNNKCIPHPLTGIAPQAQLLLGKVGTLLFTQRVLALKGGFASINNLLLERHALHSVLGLERDLRSLKILDSIVITEREGRESSVHDLRSIAECYRLSALLLLYRGFPDLLQRIVAQSNAVSRSPPESGDSWLRSLALHTLDVLSRCTPGSRTRSSEQVLLVIIAGELRLPSNNVSVTNLQSFDDCFEPFPLFAGTRETVQLQEVVETDKSPFWSQSCIPQVAEHHSDLTAVPNSIQGICSGLRSVDTAVRAGRKTVMSRLASVREILPCKSVDRVKHLIEESWRQNDQGIDTFWMDIMIQRGWKIPMV